MIDRKIPRPGKNPMPKPKITEKSKNNNSLSKFMKTIEEEPLKRDEYSMIRQFLRDKLHQ